MNTPRILVVEDEAIVAMDIKGHLALLGYDVVGDAASGERALQMAAEHRPDLVLMDIRLGGAMDGVEAAQHIRNRFQLPVVFLTAYSEDASLEPAKQAGSFGYVLKPFEDRELKLVIEMALYKHRAEEEIRRLSRLYAVLSHVDHLIARAGSRSEILQQVCRVLVEHGEFALAWIAWADPKTRAFTPAAHWGDEHGYLDQITAFAEDRLEGSFPASLALREGRSVIVNDGLDHEAASPWPGAATRFGFRTSAAFPIRHQGEVCGLLTICATEQNSFQKKEIDLLEEVVLDVSSSLNRLETEEQRKLAEQALRESSQLSQQIIASAQEGINVLGRDLKCRVWNPYMEQLTGLPISEVLGKNPIEVFPFLTETGLPERLQKLLVGEVPGPLEYPFYNPQNGRSGWVAETASPLRNAEGEIIGVIGIVREITERKQAEEQLRKLSRLVEQSPSGVLMTDREGNIEYVNPKFSEMTGYSLKEVLGRNPRLLKSGETSAEKYKRLWETITGGREWRGQFHNRKKSGDLYWEAAYISPIQDEAGQITHFVAVKEDITARKQAESERARLLDMLDASLNELYVFDAKTLHFKYANAGALRNLGYTREAIWQMTPLDLKPDFTPETFEQLIAPLRNHEQITIRFQTKHRRADDSLYPVEVNLQLFEYEHEASFLAVILDITERLRLEDQLRQAQKMEAVGQLAGGVAHDFNNILAAMLMHLGLLQSDPQSSPEMILALKELENEATRAANLTRQLLAFSRRQVLQVKPLDLNQVLNNLLRMLRRVLGEHIDLAFQPDATPVWVEADEGMMEQVVMNLCVNARDAMPKGGRLTLATQTIEIEAESNPASTQVRSGRYVCVSVADTGSGIQETALPRLFEPFFTTKEVGKGTGLGLATAYGIVKQHQGWIEVESAVGQGSTFRVFLPAIVKPVEVQLPSRSEDVRGGSETILLVEDEPSVRRMVAICLRKYGYDVMEATNGVEALRVWEQRHHQIDLILTDMVMPEGVTGLELAERLRGEKDSLKVIITSGYSVEMARLDAQAARQVIYLAKPYELAKLASIVRDCLDQK